ncbi:MAG: AmmeMemoRadiSam system radical SAM enzyme [Candidatus Pacebacteria bacterium]|nr:AmmeMemoRadiSam system radical SAM enzyme [Candidatus Paceibacterota bacterium]
MKEALLYKTIVKNQSVQCRACNHFCIIAPGKRGKCGVRENKYGKLFSLVWGRINSLNIDPIEKKPFFHFLPGSQTLSLCTVGCNFACRNCQNWQISQGPKIDGKIDGQNFLPQKIIEIALKYKIPSISYTYTEPTVFFEYALEIMKLAKQKGIKNCWISNGFMSKDLIEIISPYLDAINVDLKSFSEEFYQKYCKGRLHPILENLKNFKKRGIWVEITTLFISDITSISDIKKIAKFIKNELGSETPWHISRFFPEISWQLRTLPSTPIQDIKDACQIGLDEGLKYVYAGNVPGLASEDTYCPKCHKKMINRTGYFIERFDKNGKCSNCQEDLNIIEQTTKLPKEDNGIKIKIHEE